MSYLNSGQKQKVNDAFGELHNFFAAKNTFYAVKEGEITIMSENNDFNAFYNFSNTNNVQKTYETGVFNARAYYLNKGTNLHTVDFNKAGNKVDLGAQVADNVVKIVTNESGKIFLEDVKRINWDGKWFDKKSVPKSHGLFQNNFYTYFLEEVK